MIRRINFFAGPGSGKSVLAAKVFAELKIKGYDVEHIGEFVKTMAHEGRFPTSYDQLYIFGEQVHREDIALRHVNQIVTDCPILLCAVYAEFYGFEPHQHLYKLAKCFEKDFPSLNFYIERTVEYVNKGRYQELKEAKKFDELLLTMMGANLSSQYVVRVDQFDEIIGKIETAIKT